MVSHSLAVLDRLPRALLGRLVGLADRWRGPAVEPTPSASVVLLRNGSDGLQTFLLHRHARMGFAASMVVFPGGGVDPVDRTRADPVVACAVRETAEETGVRLPADGLRRWAHWITPEIEPRRYDTVFFVAVLPPDQDAADLSGETDHAQWWRPVDALAAADRGTIGLMPPTRSILLELADSFATADVLDRAVGRIVETVLPTVVRAGSGWVFRYPRGDVRRLDG